MPEARVDHLLIGGGIAGATCARTLRELGATGTIALVGREPSAPYHRPPLSKEYLRGESSRDQGLVLPDAWWGEHDVELMTRVSVMSLDLAARTAKLSDRREIAFDQALLATGAMVRRLNVEGAGLEGIHYLRAPGNADALREDLTAADADARPIVIVGGSYIGCEVAASLAALGRRCTIVMQERAPFERTFGLRVGRVLQAKLESHGIDFLASEEVVAFEGPEATPAAGHAAPATDDPRVAAVLLASGRRLPAALVVAGVGAVPDVALARRAGLEIGELGGVVTDRFLATSAPGIYAAGDICEYDSALHGRRMRIEHEDVAAQQGATAAHNMLGSERAHTTPPFFFSDLSDWVSLEYVGLAQAWEEEVIDGSLEDLDCLVSYLAAGRVVGALSFGRPDALEEARRLICA